jgi:Ion channel
MIFVGPPDNRTLPRQGLSRAKELVLEEWEASSFGLTRVIRLLVLCLLFLFPTIYIDQLHLGDRRAIVGAWREGYYLCRGLFIVIAFVTPMNKSGVAVGFIAYFLCDILVHLLGGALVWGKYSIDAQRSLVLALFNYGETILAFSVFYLYFDCINWKCAPTATQALYFSAVTATTVGYGDLTPVGPTGQRLVMFQLVIFAAFVVLFLTTFISRIKPETRD